MKTTILSLKLFVLALATLLVLSCSGEDGEDGAIGPMGTPGIDGVDGEDGQIGANGVDGNANVIASAWTDIDFPANWDGNDEASFDVTDTNITQEVVDSYALLGYTRFSSSTTAASAIPFVSIGQQYEIYNSMQVGKYTAFAIVNDRVARPAPPTNHQVRYILIAPSAVSGKTNSPSLEKMKEDGIDTTNYTAVMDYLGLAY